MEQDDEGVLTWMVTLRGTATVVEDEAWPENVLVRIEVGSVADRTY